MIARKGHGEWKGDLKKGSGTLGTESGAIKKLPYSFASRFESGKGTNPEELLAAAHSACFSMALSAAISGAGFKVISVNTEDTVLVEKKEDGFAITHIDVITEARVEGIDESAFQKIAEETKKGCPVSKALSGIPITLRATLKK